ncbi:MAG TPA: hypothetical protein VMB78_06965 [Dissulfurispiraceae bacterium]|nr:hypothetical protein [Dissulfurispiraceae bacterium]
MNDAVSAAVSVLAKTIALIERKPPDEVEPGEMHILRECAAVIARCTTDELLSAIKGKKEIMKI